MVSFANLKVRRVVCWRHFDCASAKRSVNSCISNNRNLASNHGQDSHPTNNILVACIAGIDRHGSITQNSFRTRGGNADICSLRLASAWLEWITHIGQLARCIDVIDLQIRDGTHTARTPIDDTLPAIDQSFFVQAHEDFTHRLRQTFIKREALTRPVARSA